MAARPSQPNPASRTQKEAALESSLGVRFDDLSYLQLALTHRSYAYEHGEIPDNERLEFLGDSVLSIIITTELYHQLADVREGRLAKVRAATVSTTSLAKVGEQLNIGDAVLLGIGEIKSGGHKKERIVANTVEAVIGAMYLDQGLEKTSEVVLRLFKPILRDANSREFSLDWKTSLQEFAAAHDQDPPHYEVTFSGPDHLREFTATVTIGSLAQGVGIGRSKKQAEQEAAKNVWQTLQEKE